MITFQEIPLAALDLESVLPILFIILYGVSQLMGGKKNKPQGNKGPRPPQMPQPGKQPPQGAGQQAGGGPAGLEQVLRKEVDEFLRRAQGKPPKPELKPREVVASRPQAAPRRLSTAKMSSAKSHPEQKGLARQRPTTQPAVKLRGMDVSEHVAKHVSSGKREISQHAEHLGEELALTDERLESRLHKKFDRKIGQLQRQELETVEARVDVAAEIAEMLSKPTGMRQMIIANEILRRPVE